MWSAGCFVFLMASKLCVKLQVSCMVVHITNTNAVLSFSPGYYGGCLKVAATPCWAVYFANSTFTPGNNCVFTSLMILQRTIYVFSESISLASLSNNGGWQQLQRQWSTRMWKLVFYNIVSIYVMKFQLKTATKPHTNKLLNSKENFKQLTFKGWWKFMNNKIYCPQKISH